MAVDSYTQFNTTNRIKDGMIGNEENLNIASDKLKKEILTLDSYKRIIMGEPLQEWETSYFYDKGDLTRDNNDIWQCKLENNGKNPVSNPIYWEEYTIPNLHAWNTTYNYSKDQIVQATDGIMYISDINNNKGYNPIDEGFWKQASKKLVDISADGTLFVNKTTILNENTVIGNVLTEDNRQLDIKTNDSYISAINLYGRTAGAGRLYVGKSMLYGGGIEYHSKDKVDGVPNAGKDYLSLYRRDYNSYSWTARNKVDSDDWEWSGSSTIRKNLTVDGWTAFNGNCTLGNEGTDLITINGDVCVKNDAQDTCMVTIDNNTGNIMSKGSLTVLGEVAFNQPFSTNADAFFGANVTIGDHDVPDWFKIRSFTHWQDNTDFNDTLTIDNDNGNLWTAGTLVVDSSSTLGKTGDDTLTVSGSINVTNNAQDSDTFTVNNDTGRVYTSGDMVIDGSTNMAKALTIASGYLTLGDGVINNSTTFNGWTKATVFYDKEDSTYFGNFAGTSYLEYLGRNKHETGHLVGGYVNIGDNKTKTSPIYTIGASYNPNENNLGNMCGIGYSHTDSSFIGDETDSGWGMYIADGGSANIFLNATTGRAHLRATSADYADIAEYYLGDDKYEAGTVLAIGGDNEVTLYEPGMKLAGCVSTNAAYVMNVQLNQENKDKSALVALKGRIPCKVYGFVSKGQYVIADNNGHGVGIDDYNFDQSKILLGIALTNSSNGFVEIKV